MNEILTLRGDEATRFKPGQSGNKLGRPSVRWIRDILGERDPEGKEWREAIVRHLCDVATKWEVLTVGYDRKLEEPIRVASARDSVEAAKLLLGYDVGKPQDNPTLLAIAEYFRKVERDRIDLLLAILGDRAKSMKPEELGAYFRECGSDAAEFVQQAEAYLSRERAAAELPPSPAAADGAALPRPQSPESDQAAGDVGTEGKAP